MEEMLAGLMFLVAFLLIFLGYPVSFSLGGTALIFAFIGIELELFNWAFMSQFPQRVFGIMSNYVLLAVPFFILMGTMLEKSKLAEELLTTIGVLFGRVRGGLALAVIFVGALLAAATGVVGASVVAMGMISMPVMLKNGYSKSLASGVIVSSGTLGQIIPPSVVLVVLASQLGISVGDLFVGSLLPGIGLACLYALYVLIFAWLKPEDAPAMKAAELESVDVSFLGVVGVLVPPLLLIGLVLGSIFAGIATPTEAGALGAVGAMVLAALKKRLNRHRLWDSLEETAQLTTMVLFLLIGSTLFTLVFTGLNGESWVEEILTNLPGGKVGLLVVANVSIFILGFFIDFFEIAFIVLPLLVPAANLLGIDLVWFGVMVGLNLQTSFLTPPFGFSLFYLRGVAPPEVQTTDIYKGALPFIGIQILALILLCVFPEIVHVLL